MSQNKAKMIIHRVMTFIQLMKTPSACRVSQTRCCKVGVFGTPHIQTVYFLVVVNYRTQCFLVSFSFLSQHIQVHAHDTLLHYYSICWDLLSALSQLRLGLRDFVRGYTCCISNSWQFGKRSKQKHTRWWCMSRQQLHQQWYLHIVYFKWILCKQ